MHSLSPGLPLRDCMIIWFSTICRISSGLMHDVLSLSCFGPKGMMLMRQRVPDLGGGSVLGNTLERGLDILPMEAWSSA